MKVHLLKRYAGPEGNFAAGRVIDVPDENVAALEAAGAVERIASIPEYVATVAPVSPAPEVAVDRASVRRKKATAK